MQDLQIEEEFKIYEIFMKIYEIFMKICKICESIKYIFVFCKLSFFSVLVYF